MADVDVAAPNGANGLTSPTTPLETSPLDPNLLIDYLVSLLSVTLGADRADFQVEGSFLSRSEISETLQKCSRFLSEPQVTLYACKQVSNPEDSDTLNGQHGMKSNHANWT